MASFRRTKIIATLGPATDDEEVLRQLIAAGVDVVRLNFSHDDRASHGRRIAAVRQTAREVGRVVAVMQDLQGPKIRIGTLEGGSVELKPGAPLAITTRKVEGTEKRVSTDYKDLPRWVHPGDPILIDDGLIELRVTAVSAREVQSVVVDGGILSEHKGVNLPRARLTAPALTKKDREDLRFGLAQGVDIVALSFVRRPEDGEVARRIIKESGRRVPLLAKIERPQALDHVDGILSAFDGVMVARGDLAIELSAEKVPVAQKWIIERANTIGKPVITATQMLDSMTRNPRPTRAEASDVANAVLDGTDAVMLSGETAVGEYPVATVEAMDRIVREAETIPMAVVARGEHRRTRAHAVCHAAVTLAAEIKAEAVAAHTRSGRTATILSKLHPRAPIFALTERAAIARQLALWRGVVPLVVKRERGKEDLVTQIGRELRARGLVAEGGVIVIVGAAPAAPAGGTNVIRLLSATG